MSMSELQTGQQEVFDYVKNNLGEGMIDVHALTTEAAEEVQTGRMDARVCQMEGLEHDLAEKSS